MSKATAVKKVAVKKVAVKKSTPAKSTVVKWVVNPEHPYRPKAIHNIRSWHRLTDVLGKKGGASHEDMAKALTYPDKDFKALQELSPKFVKQEHTDFIGYMERGKHIKKA
jgi:hypothetical protein